MTSEEGMTNQTVHLPVMRDEVLEYLVVRPGGTYIDCTVGGGGHARAILEAAAPDGRLLGIDADPEALAVAREQLAPHGQRVSLVNRYFDAAAEVARPDYVPADGMLCDLGVSSLQLDRPERGFSFQREGPLDMRFGPDADLTASEIVNGYSEEDLAKVIFEYGEERRSRRIARAIVERRPLRSTLELAKAVEQAAGKGRVINPVSRVHPATKTFLALRLEVNQELRRLSDFLALARGLLGFGSRLVIIAFHSLEDRIVKNFLRDAARAEVPSFRLLTKKVVRPSTEEVQANPRARSARLRAAEAI